MSQSEPNAIEPATAREVAATPGPVAAGHVKPRAGISNQALNLLLGGALVFAVAGVAFAVGRMTAPAAAITGGALPGGVLPGGGVFNGNGQVQVGNAQGRPGGNGQGGIGVVGNGAGPTLEGTVESISGTTLTLKTADGQTIQIALSDATTYHAQTDASTSDVVTGSKVLVRLDFRRVDGGSGPSATAGTGATIGMSASDVTVVP